MCVPHNYLLSKDWMRENLHHKNVENISGSYFSSDLKPVFLLCRYLSRRIKLLNGEDPVVVQRGCGK